MNAMIEGYHNAGWQVYLLSMNTSRHNVKEETLHEIYKHLHRFVWVNIDNKLKPKEILKNFLFSSLPEHVVRFSNEGFKRKIKSAIAKFNPDVIQIESVYLSSYLSTIRKCTSAETVLRMHNVEYQIWQGVARKTKNFAKHYYLENLTERIRNYERKVWQEYGLLLAITEKDAALALRLESNVNVIVAPFTIDKSQIKKSSQTEKWVGYHIGAMDWMPNVSGVKWFLNKAIPKIHKSCPDFKFYFAGRNMPKEFKNINVRGVECLGEVPDAGAFIADKKILIVPIWSGGGIRVKILEAMAAGKLVITTPKGIKGIEAQPDKHFLLARTPEGFAKAIKWTLDNKSEAEKIAENATKLVIEKYEQTRMIQNVIAHLETMLDK